MKLGIEKFIKVVLPENTGCVDSTPSAGPPFQHPFSFRVKYLTNVRENRKMVEKSPESYPSGN